jgi:hypothetical protein
MSSHTIAPKELVDTETTMRSSAVIIMTGTVTAEVGATAKSYQGTFALREAHRNQHPIYQDFLRENKSLCVERKAVKHLFHHPPNLSYIVYREYRNDDEP